MESSSEHSIRGALPHALVIYSCAPGLVTGALTYTAAGVEVASRLYLHLHWCWIGLCDHSPHSSGKYNESCYHRGTGKSIEWKYLGTHSKSGILSGLRGCWGWDETNGRLTGTTVTRWVALRGGRGRHRAIWTWRRRLERQWRKTTLAGRLRGQSTLVTQRYLCKRNLSERCYQFHLFAQSRTHSISVVGLTIGGNWFISICVVLTRKLVLSWNRKQVPLKKGRVVVEAEHRASCKQAGPWRWRS